MKKRIKKKRHIRQRGGNGIKFKEAQNTGILKELLYMRKRIVLIHKEIDATMKNCERFKVKLDGYCHDLRMCNNAERKNHGNSIGVLKRIHTAILNSFAHPW